MDYRIQRIASLSKKQAIRTFYNQPLMVQQEKKQQRVVPQDKPPAPFY